MAAGGSDYSLDTLQIRSLRREVGGRRSSMVILLGSPRGQQQTRLAASWAAACAGAAEAALPARFGDPSAGAWLGLLVLTPASPCLGFLHLTTACFKMASPPAILGPASRVAAGLGRARPPCPAPQLQVAPRGWGQGVCGEKKGHLLFSSSSWDRSFSSSGSGVKGTGVFSEIPGEGRG